MPADTEHILYLHADEKKLWEKLPKTMTSEWVVKAETVTFADTPEKMQVRMRNLSVDHPALHTLQLQSKKKKFTKAEIAKIIDTVDLSGLSEKDVLELAFAWGPDVITTMISGALSAAQSANDVCEVAHLFVLRHGLLLALKR